jgi:hypothetical protein
VRSSCLRDLRGCILDKCSHRTSVRRVSSKAPCGVSSQARCSVSLESTLKRQFLSTLRREFECTLERQLTSTVQRKFENHFVASVPAKVAVSAFLRDRISGLLVCG